MAISGTQFYTLQLNANGGSCSPTSISYHYYVSSGGNPFPLDSSESLPTPTRTGYSFTSWNLYSASNILQRSYATAGALWRQIWDPGDTSVNTIWYKTLAPVGENYYFKTIWTIISYTYTFKNSTSEYPLLATYSGDYNTSFSGYDKTTPVKTGDIDKKYIFIGWNTDPNAETTIELPSIFSGNRIFYAIYQPIEHGAFKGSAPSTQLNTIKLGTETDPIDVEKVYLGETLIWEKE